MVKGVKPKVYDFLMSLDYGVCHGPIDSYNEVRFKDKVGWVGPCTVDSATYIEKNELFGGDDGGEGGVSGTLEFFMGKDNQRMSGTLAGRFRDDSGSRLSPADLPGYRGLAHVFFHGSRPPGEEMEMKLFPPIVQNWSSSLGGLDNDSEFKEIVIEEGSFEAQQIDSGLVSMLVSGTITGASGGSQTWTGGAKISALDASGAVIATAGGGSIGGVATSGPQQGQALPMAVGGSGSVPPLTRRFRTRAGISRNYVDSSLIATIRFSQGWLTNYFGDNFEFGDVNVLSSDKGFKWATNNPYMQGPTLNLTRAPKTPLTSAGVILPIVDVNDSGVYLISGTFAGTEAFEAQDDRRLAVTYATVTEEVLDTFFGPSYQTKQPAGNKTCRRTHLPDANPAHMILECMTNKEWGKGDPIAAFDLQSYEDAAQILVDEHFGLSMMWTGQDKIETFVGEVLDHIKGMQFQDPQTGLWTLKLLRDDYTPSACPVFDESNCRVSDVKTRLWGETINKIIVTYTDPETETESTVEESNLANISIQGGILSDTRPYHGIRNPWLAKIVARRDLAEASAILTSCTIKAPRSKGDVRPGDVIKLEWPRHGINGYYRINEVDPGGSKNKEITLKVTEDVFSVVSPNIAVAAVKPPVNPDDAAPTNIPNVGFIPAPYFMLAEDRLEAAGDSGNTLIVLAYDPQRNYRDIELRKPGSDPYGIPNIMGANLIFENEGVQLPDGLEREPTSALDPDLIFIATDGEAFGSGDVFMLGDDAETHEIISINRIEPFSGTWIFYRGIHDTVPREHPPGTRMRKIVTPIASGDNSLLEPETELTYYLLPRNFNGPRLAIEIADPHTFTMENRQARPFRPAACNIVPGNTFSTLDPTPGRSFVPAYYSAEDLPADIELSWANRNRMSEVGPIIPYLSGNVTPEPGQTTTIRFWGGPNFDVLDHEITGLTGTEVLVPDADLTSFRFYEVEFLSVRDGLESWRSVRLQLEIERVGYGNNYGYDYGENNGELT